MKVQFANGKVYEVADIDEAIAKCLADGNDPFNPVVLLSLIHISEPTRPY